MDTPRRLPPLNQLRALEAAVRHGSFKAAARELAVTPAAVSHQVRELEAQLGLLLFERRTRQIVPTAHALHLYPVLKEGFDAFSRAVRTLAPDAESHIVTLTLTPAFASQCLLPRLPQLQHQHPDIQLRLVTSDLVADLAQGDADIAIRYGDGPFAGHETIRLADDQLLPVASPQLQLRHQQDLARHALIHFEWLRRGGQRPTWQDWLQRAGLTHKQTASGLRFSEVAHAVQAAVAGQGVALLNRVLIADALVHGTLEAPFGPAIDVPGWTLLRHESQRPSAAQQAVWHWLARLGDDLGAPAPPAPMAAGHPTARREDR